ncbi:hypothetical protein HYDPIDRAFT_170650 [Hydnomerulius pinastri MD-312]|uniref:Uncharacterized protein n=1 Tax=Hydnomerulius pinastri MD-312 TaxID=994086 RepID=A0A0C9W9W3_9AGAM|nr:hypothetical protein HYDPIDRAFT_170650 [Hydnomerulius pinastri MD-312]
MAGYTETPRWLCREYFLRERKSSVEQEAITPSHTGPKTRQSVKVGPPRNTRSTRGNSTSHEQRAVAARPESKTDQDKYMCDCLVGVLLPSLAVSINPSRSTGIETVRAARCYWFFRIRDGDFWRDEPDLKPAALCAVTHVVRHWLAVFTSLMKRGRTAFGKSMSPLNRRERNGYVAKLR